MYHWIMAGDLFDHSNNNDDMLTLDTTNTATDSNVTSVEIVDDVCWIVSSIYNSLSVLDSTNHTHVSMVPFHSLPSWT